MSGLHITFVEDDGNVREFDNVEPGQTLMEFGRAQGVKNILGDCGGGCACATCHVYIDAAWWDRVGPPDDVEAEMLDMVADVARDTSRLACQIKLSDALDGLKVEVAPM